ncbi:MAG: hypothetical protein KA347_06730 [Bacteroidia bacterium]|nr:hypothetical protein [Bacteroidia bacterium]
MKILHLVIAISVLLLVNFINNMVKYFKCIKVLLFLMIMLQACLPISVVNKDYWSCNSTDSSVYFANSLYFEGVLEKDKFNLESMILYNNGFCALHYKHEFWKQMSHKQFLKRRDVCWGRYKLLKDSLVIQYFSETGCGGGSPFLYTVHQLAGKILEEGSISITSYQFNNGCSYATEKKGYVIIPIDTVKYFVKNIPFPSDSLNWLQKKNFK